MPGAHSCRALTSLARETCGEGFPGFALLLFVTLSAPQPVAGVVCCAPLVIVRTYSSKPEWYTHFLLHAMVKHGVYSREVATALCSLW